MTGHLFLVQGDLARLHCDAWLLPCGPSMNAPGFRASLDPSVRERLGPELARSIPGWPARRAAPFPEWAEAGPIPILTDVGGGAHHPIEWYLEGVGRFLEEAGALLRVGRPEPRRARPLLGVPLVGTGRGGAARRKGDMLQALVPFLHEECGRRGWDIALVTWDALAFAAAQLARRQLGQEPWAELTETQRDLAADLAARARRGRLALFMGAGVGAAVGLPTWKGLLKDLAARAGMQGAETAELEKYGFLDQATLLGKRLGKQGLMLEDEVVDAVEGANTGLGHALLACLPVQEAVTLNYDSLYEEACRAAGRPVSVLPYDPAAEGGRWLLKLHGCVSKKEDIVLKREDYLRFEDRRQALAGVVQGLLLTRHLLFTGFSLGDDNFHRIADAVLKADETGESCFGTALMATESALLRELWEPRVRLEFFGTAGEMPAEAFRRQEIFLDRVLSLSAPVSRHLLDPAFDALLTPADRALRDGLKGLAATAGAGREASEAWEAVHDLLRDLGWKGPGGGPA